LVGLFSFLVQKKENNILITKMPSKDRSLASSSSSSSNSSEEPIKIFKVRRKERNPNPINLYIERETN
jgi:hypothetical protein